VRPVRDLGSGDSSGCGGRPLAEHGGQGVACWCGRPRQWISDRPPADRGSADPEAEYDGVGVGHPDGVTEVLDTRVKRRSLPAVRTCVDRRGGGAPGSPM
jgi:hypothetical protein